jgi:hypothetical protein
MQRPRFLRLTLLGLLAILAAALFAPAAGASPGSDFILVAFDAASEEGCPCDSGDAPLPPAFAAIRAAGASRRDPPFAPRPDGMAGAALPSFRARAPPFA